VTLTVTVFCQLAIDDSLVMMTADNFSVAAPRGGGGETGHIPRL